MNGEGLIVGEEIDDTEVTGILGGGYKGESGVDGCAEDQGHEGHDEGGKDGGVGHFGDVKEGQVERMTEVR